MIMPVLRLVLPMLRACGLILAMAQTGHAQSHLCDAAAGIAAQETGVPLSILRTLTRVETGRVRAGSVAPWPWTLNMGGAGTWHDDFETALAAAQRALESGQRNIDLGCFQINHHWHGAEFSTLADMLDPVTNARYAASFLHDLHQEFRDWEDAIAAFHSRNVSHAGRYLERYRTIAAALEAPHPASAPDRMTLPRANAAMPLPMPPNRPVFAQDQAGLLLAARPIYAGPVPPLRETR